MGLNVLAPGLLGLLAVQTGLRIVHSRILARSPIHLRAALRAEATFSTCPWASFSSGAHGDLVALLALEVYQLGEFVTETLLALVPACWFWRGHWC